MNQALFFLISIIVGAGLRVLYFGSQKLAKTTNIKVMYIVLDFVWTAIACCSFMLLSVFLVNGEFHFFMLAGILSGFFTVSIWL